MTQGNPFADQLATPATQSGDLHRDLVLPGLHRLVERAVSAPGTLAVGSYTVSGTDTDNFGDTGTWTYALTVNPRTVTQGSPKTGNVTQGNPFTDQLTTTTARVRSPSP